ncbi:rhamnose binding lectin-like precursor, partial [Silurus asotus]
IEIISASYGRTDSRTCSAGVPFCSTMNTNCHGPNARATVAALCNGRRTCTLEASDKFFIDPCTGTTKYLTVSYKCKPILKRKVFCEGSSAVLACGNRRLKFHSANYGRLDSTTCAHRRNPCETFNKTCRSHDSLRRITARCAGHNHCVIPVASSFFSDPCFGTYKYLKVAYYC